MERNNLIKKGVAVAVILLFISVSVIPSTRPTVEEKSTAVTFVWIDDDGGLSNNNTDGVIPMVPPKGPNQPVPIQFSVQNENHEYLGEGNLSEDKKNISISGDSLFLEMGGLTLDRFPSAMVGYDVGEHKWYVNITPIMNTGGGEIKIAIDWGSYGSHEETLTVGGMLLNGSIVTISPTEFPFYEDVKLSITVTGPTGVPMPNARVSLYWLCDNGSVGARINHTTKPDYVGGNVYSFLFNTTQQSEWQLNESNGWNTIEEVRNITAYVDVVNIGYGYSRAMMNSSNLKFVWVDDDFNPSTPGWGYNHFDKIQDGVDAVSQNGTVFVYNGTYYENVEINTSISLIGENKNTTINGVSGESTINILKDRVLIKGFIIRGGFGISSLFTSNLTIIDNYIDTWFGIFLISSSDNIISRNFIEDNWIFGIQLSDCRRNQILNNTFRNNNIGISLDYKSNRNIITGNTISENEEYGLYLHSSFFNVIKKNNFIQNNCSISCRNSSFNFLLRNYWDDWNFNFPRPIKGTRYSFLLRKTIDWIFFDWRPAQKPYDIPQVV